MKKITGILTLIVALIIMSSSVLASESFEQTAVVTENTEESGIVYEEEMIKEDNTDYTADSLESLLLENGKLKKHITIGDDEFELKITPSRTDHVEVVFKKIPKDKFISVLKPDWNDDLGRMKPPVRLK